MYKRQASGRAVHPVVLRYAVDCEKVPADLTLVVEELDQIKEIRFNDTVLDLSLIHI